LQNPVKANICSHPCDYRWSSCRCHFKQFNSFTKHITVDTSLIDSHFVSEKNFYRILGEKIVSRCELTEKGQVNPVREDVRNHISAFNSMKSDNSLKVLLEIKETDRVGLGQLQEKVCEGK
jgi:hypothetical protein